MASLNTAEGRLYRWLKRKTTPAGTWKRMTQAELGAKVRCSKSQISRVLPRVVAKLNSIPLEDAAKLVSDVMAVRRGRLLDFEVEVLRALRQKEPPVSYFRLSFLFGVSEEQISTVCRDIGLCSSKLGDGSSYWSRDALIPADFQHRLAELKENAAIRKHLQERQRICAEKRELYGGKFNVHGTRSTGL